MKKILLTTLIAIGIAVGLTIPVLGLVWAAINHPKETVIGLVSLVALIVGAVIVTFALDIAEDIMEKRK